MSDGGMQWWAERGDQEQREREAAEMSRMLKEHGEWIENFKRGLTPTNVNNTDKTEV